MAFADHGFVEKTGSPRERFDVDEGAAATRIFQGPWGNRHAFLEEVMGTYEISPSYVFTPPQPYPDVAGTGFQVNLLPKNAEIRPLEGSAQGVITDYGTVPVYTCESTDPNSGQVFDLSCQITIQYEYIEYTPFFDRGIFPDVQATAPGTHITVKHVPEIEIVTVQGAHYQYFVVDPPVAPFASGIDLPKPNVLEQSNVGLPVVVNTYDITWHNVALPQWDAIDSTNGLINGNPEFLGGPRAATLFQFLGARQKRTWNFTRLYDIDYRFTMKTVVSAGNSNEAAFYGGGAPTDYEFNGVVGRWNRRPSQAVVVFDDSSKQPWRPVTDREEQPPFTEGDFIPLFTLGSPFVPPP